MKSILTIIFCLVLIVCASTTYADPYLSCDPMTPEVTRINVELNGQLINVDNANIIKQADAWLLVDLSTITDGSYTVRANAEYGVWGASDWSADFLFVKPATGSPVNIRLEMQ